MLSETKSASGGNKQNSSKGFASIIVILLVVAILGVGGWFAYNSMQTGSDDSMENNSGVLEGQDHEGLSPQVVAALDDKAQLTQNLVSDPDLVAAIVQESENYSELTQTEITNLDQELQKAPANDSRKVALQNNAIAQILHRFQENNPGFVELFITNTKGVNLGQTNPTSDYYQADEDWWIDSYADGQGRLYHGPMEYDESAQSESISIYTPIYSDGIIIGVMKSVIDITAIQREL